MTMKPNGPKAENNPKRTSENQKVLIIPLAEWEQFYKELTSNLEPYDHYDTGYQDALDRVDDWMDTHTETKETTHGHWIKIADLCGIPVLKCSVCGGEHPRRHTDKYCVDCGAKISPK